MRRRSGQEQVRIGTRRPIVFKGAILTAALAVVGAMAGVAPSSAAGTTARGAASPWPGETWQPDEVRYGMTVEPDVPVRMNDGATLIANIGYPTDLSTGQRASGIFPVLLTQDPYVAESQPQGFYVARGYINAVVQVRGTVNTFGPGGKALVSDEFGPRQAQDGVALVKWASHLQGSNGEVGLDGCSYLGIDQIFTAAAAGPHSAIKEILPACASNGYETYFAGGMPSQIVGLFTAVSSVTLSGPRNARVNDSYNAARKAQILSGGPQAYDGTYWRQRTTYYVIPKIVHNHIPALLWSGWYPTDGPGSLLEYAIFQNTYDHRPPFGPMSPNQPVTGRYQVVIGPWSHGQGLDDSIQLEWYDTWLKGEKTRIAQTDTPMHLYDLQKDDWTNAATYPLTDRYTAFHLGSEGSFRTAKSVRKAEAGLSWGPPTESGTTTSFDAAPFQSDRLIAGPIAATLWARSSTSNIDLLATLFDAGPNGQATQIAVGNLIGSLRSVNKSYSWFDETGLMVLPYHPYITNKYAAAGSLQRYDIEMTPTLYTVATGHHLRLVVSTQPATKDCASLLSALKTPLPCLPTNSQLATLKGGQFQLLWGPSTPSSVNVPVLAQDALPVTTSGTTPTSNGLIEPLMWSSSRPTQ